MDFTYNYHQTFLKDNKENEPSTEALGSKNPHTVFLNEILMEYLRELVVYIIKLKRLGINNAQIKEDIINAISMGILNIEYSEEDFFAIINRLYNEMLNAKELYINVCKRNNIKFNLQKTLVKPPNKLSFYGFIRQGQNVFNLKYTKLSIEQMSLVELFMNVIRSVCTNLVELRMLGDDDDDEIYNALLLTFALKRTYTPYIQKALPKKIEELAKINNQLIRKLYEIKREKYGKMEPAEISFNVKEGKAILVSGCNLKELELLLEATKDKDINIYTHGNMMCAHIFPKFRQYKHFAGHFGKDVNNYGIDFSDFPGAILLTRHSFLNVEKLFQCRIYSTDLLTFKGVGKIKNHDFTPLIEAAKHAEGFQEKIYNPPIKFTFSEIELTEKIQTLAQKIKNGEIKHLFTLGMANRSKQQNEYFEKFFNLLDEKSFVITFSYTKDAENFLHLQSGYSYPLFYEILEILTKTVDIADLNPIVLYARCETHTFANVIFMKMLGINKIYLADCSPALINPVLTNFVKNTFDIKSYSTPEKDLKEMLS